MESCMKLDHNNKQPQKKNEPQETNINYDSKMSVQPTDQSLLEIYDKIMAQIKQTYATLNNENLQKQQISLSKKKTQKIDKANKKLKRVTRQQTKISYPKPINQKQNVKLESQELQENLDQLKSKFNQIFRNFINNVKNEILKTEQELLKISSHHKF